MAGTHHDDQVLLITEDENGVIQDVTNILPTHGNRGIAPPLPENKVFHAFFSHSSEDNWWVRNVVERLESPEYGFHCCVADRDFDVEAPIIQNIVRSVQTSCKTVIVISPEFLTSQWCSYEAQITMEQDIDSCRRLLVPVMLRECIVPEFIGRLSYMDINDEYFWERFVAALQDVEDNIRNVEEPLGSQARFAALPFTFNPNFHNGEIVKSLTAFRCCGCCRCVSSTELDSTFVADEIVTRGIQVTPQEYAVVSQSLYRQSYVRYHCCSGSFIVAFILIMCIIALFFVIPGTIVAYTTDVFNNAFIIYILRSPNSTLMVMVAMTIIIVLVVNAIKLMGVPHFTKALKEANELLYHRNIFVSSQDHGCPKCNANKLTITFYYYEWRSCETHIYEFLEANPDIITFIRMLQTMRNNHEPLAHPDGNLREFSRSLLLDSSLEYGQLLAREKLPVPAQQRHTRQGECMCQFVERNLNGYHEPSAIDCIRRIFNSPIRDPCTMFMYL